VAEQGGQSIPGGPYVAPGVREQIYDHVFSSLEAEVGGVLIGHLREDGSPLVTDIIAALEAEGARSRVTFTHEAWSTIHSTLDHDHPGEEILGWYHSHPGFGIFLSEHDLFIHRNFFGRPEQIAIVVDPHAGSEGLFVWREGEVVKAAEESTLQPGELPEQIERAQSAERPGPSRGALAFYWALGMVFGVLVWLAFSSAGIAP
jgi:proteasome lid subunit RPN8/RPN11